MKKFVVGIMSLFDYDLKLEIVEAENVKQAMCLHTEMKKSMHPEDLDGFNE